MSGVANPMTDKPNGKRWKARDKWVALAVALFAAYMGMYYVSFVPGGFDDGRTRRREYEIFGAEFPPCSETFFAPADWIAHRIWLGGPYKSVHVRHPEATH